jgi:hypothetical protein
MLTFCAMCGIDFIIGAAELVNGDPAYLCPECEEDCRRELEDKIDRMVNEGGPDVDCREI